MLAKIQNKLPGLRRRDSKSDSDDDKKFGMFAGVFTPTVLTILGAIMYLRTGWVVGNAGLVGAIAIILLAHVITVSTGLAVSSVVTNTRVGAGGAFAIISQSLGLEVGGSVGIPLFLAQGISIALYVLAFSRSVAADFPHALRTIGGDHYLRGCVRHRLCQRQICLQNAVYNLDRRRDFAIFRFSRQFPDLGTVGFHETPVLIGDYPDANFWATFAVFFPAVTGIMVGISMSGSLRNARRDIPIGTMSAIFLTMVIYLVLAYWLSRVATPEELLTNSTIMVDKAFWGGRYWPGCWGPHFPPHWARWWPRPGDAGLGPARRLPLQPLLCRRKQKMANRAARCSSLVG